MVAGVPITPTFCCAVSAAAIRAPASMNRARHRRNLLNGLIGTGGNGVKANDQQLDLLFQEEFSYLGGIPA